MLNPRLSVLGVFLFIISFHAAAQQGGGGNGGGQNIQALGNAPVPTENPITESKRVLGKILFWDEQLSSDNTVACGTCHKPAEGGADARLAINPGFDEIFGTDDDVIGSQGIKALDEHGLQLNDPLFGHGAQVTGRVAPSFLTSMFADSNFWDGRAADEFVDPLNSDSVVIAEGGALENQALGPILSSVEMAQAGRDWPDVIIKLEQVIPLTLAREIPADMADALQGGANYPSLFAAEDLGEFNVTGNNGDRGNFKTPSLRNVGLRQALMHVGWITDVSDAIDFYNAGTNDTGHIQFTQNQSGIPNSNLDINQIDVFADDPVRRGQIVEFLSNGLTDPRVAAETFPFDRPLLSSEGKTTQLTLNSEIAGTTSDKSATSAIFSGSIISGNTSSSDGIFGANEILSISAQIQLDPDDLGKSGNIYCVIVLNGQLYALNSNGAYQFWNENLDSLPAMSSKSILGSVETVSIIEQFSQTPGNFNIYIAYDTNDSVLRYNSEPIQFSVQ
ncbi:MAG: hypothetical protein COA96_07810 [SAR86 cluster bacterium]|uniref:Di-haem cytochrome c peroxidase domain-containing protein n=1 Tax=SAR86 cluster bacterium TaxID=2030880 RepID=A0A2A5B0Z0_9GAMM|nr:MAG: hypothetical protein COA96_07810 [SAR86 cluster bacterium]